MENQDLALHYVCTLDQARDLIRTRRQFWVSNCGCREGKGGCARSRMDVCLYFNPEFPSTGSNHREVSLADVEEILREAEGKHLVTRPFRGETDRTRTDGVCFCCNDCCAYFQHPGEKCDKGSLIERTDAEQCDDCEACVDVCHFGARRMEDGSLVIDEDNCYGCGLCAEVCPQDCIEMVGRETE